MINKLNASAKLYLLVFVMSIFIIGIGVYGILEMRTMQQNAQTLYADRVVTIEQLTTIRYAYLDSIISSTEKVQTHRLAFKEGLNQIQEAEKNITVNWEAYMLTYLTPEEEQLAKQTSGLMTQSAQIIEKLKAILSKEDANALNNLINTEFYPAVKPVIAKMNELTNLQVRVGKEVYKNSTEIYKSALKRFIILIILSLAFAIPLSYYLVGSIKNLIKDLRLSNKKIAENEKKYRSLIEQAADAIFLLNDDLTINDVNTSASKLLGYSHEEFLGKKIFEMVNQNDLEKRPLQIDLLRKNKTLISERRLIRKDGTEVDVEFNGKVLEGKGLLTIARDMTERKRAENLLRESEERFSIAFRSAPVAIAATRISDGKFFEVNMAMENFLGYSRNELIGQTTIGLNMWVDPEDRNYLIHQVTTKGFLHSHDFRFRTKEGQVVIANYSAEVIELGKEKCILSVLIDITERKQIEKSLEISEKKYRNIFENVQDVFYQNNLAGIVLEMSPSIKNHTGISREEIIGTPAMYLYYNPADREKVVSLLWEKGEITDYEVIFKSKTGEPVFGSLNTRLIRDAAGNPSHIDGVFRNTTERKKAEEIIKLNEAKLKQSEANYRQLFKLSPAPMWVFDEETYRFMQVNQACINHYGYSEEEFAAMTIKNISTDNDETDTKNPSIKKNKLKDLYLGGQRHIKKSGEIIEVETSSIPVILNEKKQILAVAIDVTEKNLYEQKLMRAAIKAQEDERYEIGGELHDNVCQILSASLLSLGMMRKPLPLESKKYFEQTYKYIDLASQEIRNLSHRLAPAFFDNATLEDAFKNLLKTFNVEKKYAIRLSFDDSSRNHPLKRDLQLNLYRILQEQLRNILKHANATNIKVEVTINNNVLQMKIADDGDGFDIEGNKGGIGFANMNRRVQLFSGNFTINSAIGSGCEIKVQIPLSSP